MLDKPVPPIDDVISQIMNIVWIDDEVVTKDGIAESRIRIINYKRKPQEFILYAEIPSKEYVTDVIPEPLEIRERIIKWKISLKPSEKLELSFKVKCDGVDFDENNLYALGIDPVNIVGAEKWEGEE